MDRPQLLRMLPNKPLINSKPSQKPDQLSLQEAHRPWTGVVLEAGVRPQEVTVDHAHLYHPTEVDPLLLPTPLLEPRISEAPLQHTIIRTTPLPHGRGYLSRHPLEPRLQS